jgi:hypothetical protein
MAIIKSKHSSNFTVIPNEVFKSELSISAIGLLAYLLSLPHDWIIYKSNLHNQLKMGRDKLDRYFKELQSKGYVISVKKYNEDGTIGWEHIVYDYPFNREPSTEKPCTVKPSTGNPSTEKPSTENQQLLNKEYQINNTKEINTKETKQNPLFDFEILDEFSFDSFWDLYDKKVGKYKAKLLYDKISKDDKVKMFNHIPLYKQSKSDKQYLKDPETYLRNKAWEDEIIFQPEQQEESKYLNLFNIYKEIQDEYANKPNDGKKFGED